MENASKALIIAGAILLAILIISLGIIVYNQAKSTAGNVNLSEYQIQAFNDKFTPYEGRNVSGKQVNNLIKSVIASNTTNFRDRTGMYITLYYPIQDGDNSYTKWAVAASWSMGGELGIWYGTGKFSESFVRDVVQGRKTEVLGGHSYASTPEFVREPTYTLDMQDRLTYQVIMVKNKETGLIGAIVIAPTRISF